MNKKRGSKRQRDGMKMMKERVCMREIQTLRGS